ncbi:MAG: AMP-binding protein [Synergistales bacterium]
MDDRLEETFVSLAKGAPGQRSIWWRGAWWSRSCLMELVEGCETTLAQSGFKEGQRLALLLPNSPVTLALCLAAWRLGGTVIPLNVQAGEAEILRCTAHADVFGAYLCKGFEPLAEALARSGVSSAITPLEGPIPDLAGRAGILETPETAVIFFTSGTTGAPKAVCITHKNIRSNVDASLHHFTELRDNEVFLNALPNFHTLGFTVCGMLPMLSGMGQVIVPTFMPAESTLEVMRVAGVTVAITVPAMVALLEGAVARGAVPPQDLHILVSGGDRLPPRVAARSPQLLGIPVLEGYGLTETSPVVAVNPSYAKNRPGTVGPLIPGYTARVLDAAGLEVPPGREGTLWLQGPSVTPGYFRRPDLTADRIRGGWFDTGDMVRIDEEEYLTIVGRVSDIIIVGGFNVHPQEVEAMLQEHPSVKEAAVVGVPNPALGEVVKAYVVPQNGTRTTPRDLVAFCRDRLSHYKVPRVVEFVGELPKSSIGKVLNRELRKRAQEETACTDSKSN